MARADKHTHGIADLIATLQPTVVNITIVRYLRAGAAEGNMAGQATTTEQRLQSSGFFIDPSGIIVTNRHVVQDASEIVVTLHDSTKLRASVLATAAQSDLALLRVNAGKAVPTVSFGDSDRMRPGEPVFIIGNPLGLGSTVTAGIISALDRNTAESQFASFFQIDAALNHGSSGGPVFNEDGKVIGVSTALVTSGNEGGSVGLGLAIPANDVQFVVSRLLGPGNLRLGWIGAHVQPVTADIATAVGLPEAAGSIVTNVENDSPAAHAGLTDGDIVLKVSGEAVTEPRSLNRKIAGSTIGSVAELEIWRDGAQKIVAVMIEELQADRTASEAAQSSSGDAVGVDRHDLGLVLGPITESIHAKLGMRPQQVGVLIEDVVAHSAAADRGITAGSLLVSVDGHPVTLADVQPRIDAARSANHHFVLMLVEDQQGLQWLALPLDAP